MNHLRHPLRALLPLLALVFLLSGQPVHALTADAPEEAPAEEVIDESESLTDEELVEPTDETIDPALGEEAPTQSTDEELELIEPSGGELTEVPAYAEPVYSRGRVLEILEEQDGDPASSEFYQKVKVRLDSGDEQGQEREIELGGEVSVQGQQKVRVGDRVVVVKAGDANGTAYYIVDQYRLARGYWLLAAFFVIAIFFGRRRGATSILGLVLSVILLILVVVPAILKGGNPFLPILLGSVVIAAISLLVAHGPSRRTVVALVSTLITIGVASGLAAAAVWFARLFGFGNEDTFYLQISGLETLDLRGLLLGGIIIGTLGVLDDVTTTQAATVDELHRANATLPFRDLYRRGLSVGREHIAALVNTLAFAYIGASLPLLLLFSANQTQPLWVMANSEMIMEEVVRTLVGSTALILAVPLTTAIAAYAIMRQVGSRAGAVPANPDEQEKTPQKPRFP